MTVTLDPRDYAALTLLAGVGHAHINGKGDTAAALIRHMDRLEVTDKCKKVMNELAQSQHTKAYSEMVKELRDA